MMRQGIRRLDHELSSARRRRSARGRCLIIRRDRGKWIGPLIRMEGFEFDDLPQIIAQARP